MKLIDRNEDVLGFVAGVLAGIIWAVLAILGLVSWFHSHDILIHGVIGASIVVSFLIFIIALHSSYISHIKGNGIELSDDAFPDLYAQVKECAKISGLKKTPKVYILNGHGAFNAFATSFLWSNYIILYSNVVDALKNNPNALKFYVGHEMGHITRRHYRKKLFLLPALWLPVLGNAYSRACEYTCDRYGYACCDDKHDALLALATMAAGQSAADKINLETFSKQQKNASGFWMNINELFSTHPWIIKRAAYIEAVANGEKPRLKTRNLFSYFFALFIPNVFAGALANIVLMIYVVFVLLATTMASAKRDSLDYTTHVSNTKGYSHRY